MLDLLGLLFLTPLGWIGMFCFGAMVSIIIEAWRGN